MWGYLFEDTTHNGFTISIVALSLMFSLMALLFTSRQDSIRKKLSLIYTHLFFLFFPLVFISSMWSCQLPIFSCVQKKILWIIPLSIFATYSTGFFILPHIYKIVHKSKDVTDISIKKCIKKYSGDLGIKKVPRIYFIDSAKPIAHTFTNFTPAIFISVGMFEMLKKKEIEAVILHELHHIMNRSSFLKFSTQFARFVSPIARFAVLNEELNGEERNADNFAVQVQKTDKFLLSAKREIMQQC